MYMYKERTKQNKVIKARIIRVCCAFHTWMYQKWMRMRMRMRIGADAAALLPFDLASSTSFFFVFFLLCHKKANNDAFFAADADGDNHWHAPHPHTHAHTQTKGNTHVQAYMPPGGFWIMVSWHSADPLGCDPSAQRCPFHTPPPLLKSREQIWHSVTRYWFCVAF